MSARSGPRIVAVPLLFLCAACGLSPMWSPPSARMETPRTPARSTAAPAFVAPSPTAESTPTCSVASPGIERVARRFVKLACEYDARSEGRRDFLSDVRPLTTRAEADRLAGSSRAQLPWRVLRTRGERTRLQIIGISLVKAHSRMRHVAVEAIATTYTDFAVVREFEQIRLTVRATPSGWLVADAEGAGL
ncbi:MAG TPA: hypothetical protein VFI97_08095 [Arthrobacter sp.]|nr:hypothetical protein [Arthrobacter sp.]